MAVMIPDIEMPTDCPFCPMAHWWMHELKGCELMQRYVPKTDIEYWKSNTRPDWCPLVEVPSRPKYDAQLLKDCGMEE